MASAHALYEEALSMKRHHFARLETYPIAKMTDTPEIKVVLIHDP